MRRHQKNGLVQLVLHDPAAGMWIKKVPAAVLTEHERPTYWPWCIMNADTSGYVLPPAGGYFTNDGKSAP